MLSILIPVYNTDVTKLVDALLDEAKKIKIDYEIIAMDDGSKKSIKKENSTLSGKFRVNYIELSENIGRSKIRNWLAKLARYENLLFLDADSKIISKKFLRNYLSHIGEHSVIYGGRIYAKSKPRTVKKHLHYYYGIKKETKPTLSRKKKAYLSFMSNNFIIKQSIFNQIKFDESIIGYGYEDLVFSHSLQKIGVEILHLENPVLHNNIEYNEVFIEKSINAIENLVRLHQAGKIMDTSLIKNYNFLDNLGLINPLMFLSEKWSHKILNNLNSQRPSMLLFSLFKLKVYHQKIKMEDLNK